MHFDLNKLLRTTYLILISLLILSQELLAQDATIYRTYDKSDGFTFDVVSSMAQDDDGWTWISGMSSRIDRFKNENLQALLQRFSGNSFQTIDLPHQNLQSCRNFDIFQRSDGNFILSLTYRDEAIMYLFDPTSITFTKVEMPFVSEDVIENLSYHEVDVGNLVFTSTNTTSFIYQLDEEFNWEKKAQFPRSAHVDAVVDYGTFVLLQDTHNGLQHLDMQNWQSKAVGPPSLLYNKSGKTQLIYLKSYYQNDSLSLFQFQNELSLYQYDLIRDSWKEFDLGINFDSPFTMHSDTKGNLYIQMTAVDGIDLIKVSLQDKSVFETIYLPGKTFYDINVNVQRNDVLAAKSKKLNSIRYRSSTVRNFLKEYSIRSILELDPKNFIVTTDSDGWFRINVDKMESTSFLLKQNGNPFYSQQARAIFMEGSTIWSNNSVGIMKFDTTDREVTSYVHYPVNCMIKENSSFFYGTIEYNFMSFDTEHKTQTALAILDSVEVHDLIKVRNSFLLASDNGLFHHAVDTTYQYKIGTDPDDNHFLCIENSDHHGILLGSRSGKLFRFSLEEKSFEELYEDELGASIATILEDDNKNLWLNTFGGFVRFNMSQESSVRFGEAEGFSHFEANRHSSLETSDGHFLVGTLHGLNYFHPDSLDKVKSESELKMISVSQYDRHKKDLSTILNAEEIDELRNITLSPENRNLTIQVDVFGDHFEESIKYLYRLDDDEWKPMLEGNQLTLINLAPGTYDLQIQATDFDGVQIGETLQKKIISKDFFYKRWWFITLIFSLITAIAAFIISQLLKEKRMQEHFSKEILESQENQRAQIARELHDSVGQKLVLLSRNIKGRKWEGTEELMGGTLDEIRSISRGLHPTYLEKQGLTAAIENLLNEVDANCDLLIDYNIAQIDLLFDRQQSIQIYRVIQEVFTNIMKHSNAKAASLELAKNGSLVKISIADNGKGFVYSESLGMHSMGLRTISERVKILNGKLNVTSEIHKGTNFNITVPFEKSA